MWLFTNFGFFSVVQKTGTTHLTVRTRVKSDLDELRDRYLPELGPTQAKAGTDYPWRATVPHAALALAMGKIVMDCHYANYKNEVAAKQGKGRAFRYGQVWEALYGMKDEPGPNKKADHGVKTLAPPNQTAGHKKVAYGGVIFNADGQVLLREPKNHWDGYVWTFAKGRPDPNETPEQTALREVQEETGVRARIIAPIPGEFPGGTTLNTYFLMVPEGPTQPQGQALPETASICWVRPDEARSLIKQTKNKVGKDRDLLILEAALVAWEKWHKHE
jgi:8-oxo-dGTP pyrophosphatase MutT (NUDIX family)